MKDTLEALNDYLANGRAIRPVGLRPEEQLASPVIEFGWARLTRSCSTYNVLSAPAADAWKKSLMKRLAASVRRVVTWEVQRPAGWLSMQLSRSDKVSLGTLRLLQDYAALGQLWTAQVDNWNAFAVEFLRDVQTFLDARHFSGSQQKREVLNIKTGLSDPHRRGRSVIRVRFRNDSVWFYKPRSGAFEAGWNQILRTINEAGFSTRFKAMQVVSTQQSCWMRALPQQPCSTQREVRWFYYRYGALLYLAHMFRAVDLHAGNIIAYRGYPVVIDCETFLHPSTYVPKTARWSTRGLLRTGLLPSQAWQSGDTDNVSAIGRTLPGQHLQLWNGRVSFAQQYVEDFVAGFDAMHRVSRNKLDFHALAERFIPRRVRAIYRPSTYYALIYQASLTPPMLRNPSDRSEFLYAACAANHLRADVTRQEADALMHGDIPLFYSKRSQPRPWPSERVLHALIVDIRRSLAATRSLT
jgi:lantibiotic modifying enzyme